MLILIQIFLLLSAFFLIVIQPLTLRLTKSERITEIAIDYSFFSLVLTEDKKKHSKKNEIPDLKSETLLLPQGDL